MSMNVFNALFGINSGIAYTYLPFWGMYKGARLGYQMGGLGGAVRGAFIGVPTAYRAHNQLTRTNLARLSRSVGDLLGEQDPSGGFRPVPFYFGVGLGIAQPFLTAHAAYKAARSWQAGDKRKAAMLAAVAAWSAYGIYDTVRMFGGFRFGGTRSVAPAPPGAAPGS